MPGPHRAVAHQPESHREGAPIAGGTPGAAWHREGSGVAGQPLRAEVAVTAGTATMVLCGDLDPDTMPLLVRWLAQVLAGRPERLVLDMAGVTFIDCASARLIARAGRHLPGGPRPAIRSPSLAVRRVLELTGLADHLDTVPPDTVSPGTE